MSEPAFFKFLLYVAGDGPNSSIAIANLNALCRDHLSNRHEIEIIDVFREPQRALADRILITPMLIKLSPAPICEIVGNLSQLPVALLALGLPD